MSERINIAKLHEQAERRGVFTAGDGYPAVGAPSWSDVLALVEAVEAAHWLQTCFRDHLRTDCAGFAVDQALARFDFGEERT